MRRLSTSGTKCRSLIWHYWPRHRQCELSAGCFARTREFEFTSNSSLPHLQVRQPCRAPTSADSHYCHLLLPPPLLPLLLLLLLLLPPLLQTHMPSAIRFSGSLTCRSTEYGERYHSVESARFRALCMRVFVMLQISHVLTPLLYYAGN